MKQDIRVVILEDDPFARNWMFLIAVRDWRTRVIGQVSHPSDLIPFFEDASKTDLIIMDTDIPGGEDWIPRIHQILRERGHFPKILCTGIRPNANILCQLGHPAFTGYVLKDEICYSLAWAVSQAMNGYWVITDGIQSLAAEIHFELPRPCKVLNGRNAISFLPDRQADVAKLVISSVLRKEMADEISVSEDWIYQVVSKVYDRFGVKELLNDEQALRDYVGDDEMIISYFQRVYQDSKAGKKPRDMETLAFHIITMPEMVELK